MNTTCSICLSNLSNLSNDYCITNCNHKYCYKCLNEWFNQKKVSCPMCRTNIESYIYKNETSRIIYIDNTRTPRIQTNNNANTIRIKKTQYNILICTSFLSTFFFGVSLYFIINFNF